MSRLAWYDCTEENKKEGGGSSGHGACGEKMAAEELTAMESGHDGEIEDKAPAENKVR